MITPALPLSADVETEARSALYAAWLAADRPAEFADWAHHRRAVPVCNPDPGPLWAIQENEMSGRFSNLPNRLREQSEMIEECPGLDLGDSLAIAATMRDAALKIEALERDLRPSSRKSKKEQGNG